MLSPVMLHHRIPLPKISTSLHCVSGTTRGSPPDRLQHGGGQPLDLVEPGFAHPVLRDAAVGRDDVQVRLDSERPELLLPAAVGAPVQHQNTVRVPDRSLQGRRRPGGRDAGLDRPAGAVEEHRPGLGGQFPGVRDPRTGDDGDRQSVPPERRVDPTRNLVPDPPDTGHDLLVGAGESRRVGKLPVDLLLCPGEEGAEPALADRNQIVHLLLVELTEIL